MRTARLMPCGCGFQGPEFRTNWSASPPLRALYVIACAMWLQGVVRRGLSRLATSRKQTARDASSPLFPLQPHFLGPPLANDALIQFYTFAGRICLTSAERRGTLKLRPPLTFPSLSPV